MVNESCTTTINSLLESQEALILTLIEYPHVLVKVDALVDGLKCLRWELSS